MVQWYAALSPDQQAALQGLLVMALFATIKAICYWAGKPLGDSAAAKIGKLVTVAVATAATTFVSVGLTPGFWLQWVLAFVTAVGSWEVLAKAYNAIPTEEVPL